MALRAGLTAAFTLAIAWLLTAATDEGSVPWGERAGRTLPLTPVCAAMGVWAALQPASARGEVLALEALGRSRSRLALGAVLGGAAIALVAALALAVVRSVSVAGFYPTVAQPTEWHWQQGSFVNIALGLRVDADGAIEPLPAAQKPERAEELRPLAAARRASLPSHARAAAAATTALAGIALPLLLAQALVGRRTGRRWGHGTALASAAGMIGMSIVLFQVAALGLIPASLAPLPALVLLAFAWQRYRRAS